MSRGLQGLDTWLIDSLVVPASLHDLEGRFVHVNAAAERASGNSNAELVGGHFTDNLVPEARRNVEEQFRRAVERGEPTDFETVFVDATGQVRSVRAQHLPLRDGDAIVGVLILAFDARQSQSVRVAVQSYVRLTPRQREVLELMATGMSTSQMARELGLSSVTVRNHMQGVSRALDTHSRPEAIAVAQRLGLLAAPPLGPGSEPDTRPTAR